MSGFKTYPVSLLIQGRKVLVVGGGRVALRKVKDLLSSGARVWIVAQEVIPDIRDMAVQGLVSLEQRSFEAKDLDQTFLVVAATSDRETNEKVSRAARSKGILVNAVDEPDLCDFFVPAKVVRGDLVVAVSTSGSAPGLARYMRAKLDELLPEHLAELVRLVESARIEIKRLLPEKAGFEDRRRAFEKILERIEDKLLAPEAISALKAAVKSTLKGLEKGKGI